MPIVCTHLCTYVFPVREEINSTWLFSNWPLFIHGQEDCCCSGLTFIFYVCFTHSWRNSRRRHTHLPPAKTSKTTSAAFINWQSSSAVPCTQTSIFPSFGCSQFYHCPSTRVEPNEICCLRWRVNSVGSLSFKLGTLLWSWLMRAHPALSLQHYEEIHISSSSWMWYFTHMWSVLWWWVRVFGLAE